MLLLQLIAIVGINLSTGARAKDLDSGGLAGCEDLRVSECGHLGYTHTRMPNLLGMHDQDDAQHALASFGPLLQYGCSAQLRVLLCGFYAPMCSPLIGGQAVLPCKSLCLTVRQQCAPIMTNFGYLWPLNCSALPERNSGHSICMAGPQHKEPTREKTTSSLPSPCLGPHCLCEGPHLTYSVQDKEFASVWMAIWGVVCCGVTLFCLVSFLL